MPSMQSTAILATTLLGSLLQHASAAVTPTAPEALSRRAGQFPDCIATCMRNSGCFDSKCVCKSVDEGILSDIVICMNQWCPASITAKDLIGPLEGECKLPKAAVQDAEKKGGVASDDDAEEEEDKEEDKADDKDDTPKPTATPAPSGKGDKGKDDDKKDDKDDDEEEIIMTYDLAPPVTNAGPVTTVTPVASGTLTVPTEAATTGLLIEASSSSGAFQAATASHHPVPSSVSADSSSKDSSSSDKDEDDKGSAAGIGSQASVFGIVAAMGFALAMGF